MLPCWLRKMASEQQVGARAVVDFPDVTTPAELAKQLGWSERHVRALAREIGACRILGNRMVLTKEDVDAILEATKPIALNPQWRAQQLLKFPASSYEDLVKMRAKTAPRRRVRIPRTKPKG